MPEACSSGILASTALYQGLVLWLSHPNPAVHGAGPPALSLPLAPQRRAPCAGPPCAGPGMPRPTTGVQARSRAPPATHPAHQRTGVKLTRRLRSGKPPHTWPTHPAAHGLTLHAHGLVDWQLGRLGQLLGGRGSGAGQGAVTAARRLPARRLLLLPRLLLADCGRAPHQGPH